MYTAVNERSWNTALDIDVVPKVLYFSERMTDQNESDSDVVIERARSNRHRMSATKARAA